MLCVPLLLWSKGSVKDALTTEFCNALILVCLLLYVRYELDFAVL